MKPSPTHPSRAVENRAGVPEIGNEPTDTPADAYHETMPAPSREAQTWRPRTGTGSRDPAGAVTQVDTGAAPGLFEAGTRIGQYELIRLLGRGGMGAVYRARDLRLGRLVAIKFLTDDGTQVNERFVAEARATARCQHENIVIIYGVGEFDSRPYMVLEFIEGQTLRYWLRDNTGRDSPGGRPAPLPPGRAVELMVPVVRALIRAHDSGIVHRDLKPENIMITRSGAIKVLDFGIAKLRDASRHDGSASSDGESSSSAFADDVLVGTPAYMSPEQLNGEGIDHRTDLWAVGVMLFEMVCGELPVPSRTAAAMLDVADVDTPMPAAGERRPGLGPLAGIIDRCLLKNKADRTAHARALLSELEAIIPDRRGQIAHDRDDNPFTGLAAFQEDDADRFFGREADIANLVTRVRNQPLVAVIGPSGVGKSSLVRAGVIPALKRSGEGWESVVIRPGRGPIDALCDALEQMHRRTTTGDHKRTKADRPVSGVHMSTDVETRGEDRAAVRARLWSEPGYLGAELRARARRKLRRLLLFIDQFEEIYTATSDSDERAAFLASVAGAADDAGSPLRVVVSMRSDFLERLAVDRAFMAVAGRGLAVLAPMHRDGLRAALEQPLTAAGYRFETRVMVEDMLDELQDTPGALPLLQFTASRLWAGRDRDARRITEASYQAMGGIAGTLARHADNVLATMPGPQVKLARAIFERLVTPERTRAIVDVSDLRSLPGDPDDIKEVLRALADARLVVVELGDRQDTGISGLMNPDEMPGAGAGTAEIVHESLIAGWPRLRRWLDENQDDAAFLSRLRTAAREWHRSGRSEGMLWSGDVARDARLWHEHYHGQLPEHEQRYLMAVFALADRAGRRKRRITYGITGVMVVLLVAAFVMVTMREQNKIIESQLRELDRNRVELRASLDAAQEAREEAEHLREQAEQKRNQAELAERAAQAARREAETQAEATRQALAEVEVARDNARASAAAARAQRFKAEKAAEDERAAKERAAAARKDAEAARRKAEKAAEEAAAQRREKQEIIERAVGPIERRSAPASRDAADNNNEAP